MLGFNQLKKPFSGPYPASSPVVSMVAAKTRPTSSASPLGSRNSLCMSLFSSFLSLSQRRGSTCRRKRQIGIRASIHAWHFCVAPTASSDTGCDPSTNWTLFTMHSPGNSKSTWLDLPSSNAVLKPKHFYWWQPTLGWWVVTVALTDTDQGRLWQQYSRRCRRLECHQSPPWACPTEGHAHKSPSEHWRSVPSLVRDE